jgi:DNA gyrase/topoisomerase IV subunit B
MTTTTKSLEQKIQAAVEQLVREHLAACEAAASVAVRAAFERASQPASKPSPKKSTRALARRRSPEELTALQERLYEAVRRHPGETMAVIGPVVGATAQELERPVIRLRQQGRVRSVGRRQATRYFPMGE